MFSAVSFSGTTSALMNTFTRQQYSLYAPRKKAKNKRTESNHKVKKSEQKAKKKDKLTIVKKARQTASSFL